MRRNDRSGIGGVRILRDSYGREIDYMRISITDRCNLRCRYCMPHGVKWLPMGDILTFEEIELICREAVKLGITRFKITGGEPLVRRGCPELIRRIKAIPGVHQVTMTTNGVMLEEFLDELLDAGLDAVNISLDTLDEQRFEEITGFRELNRVLESIEQAVQKGIRVKINAVLQQGVNDDEWRQLTELAETYPVDVRFIEMMPIGSGKESKRVPNDKLLQKISEVYQGQPDEKQHGNGPAVYYQIPGFQGSIGFISAIHGKFCDKCNRIRLTAVGELKPCLCFGETISIREAARAGDGETVRLHLKKAIERKPEMHHFERSTEVTEQKKMSQIGG